MVIVKWNTKRFKKLYVRFVVLDTYIHRRYYYISVSMSSMRKSHQYLPLFNSVKCWFYQFHETGSILYYKWTGMQNEHIRCVWMLKECIHEGNSLKLLQSVNLLSPMPFWAIFTVHFFWPSTSDVCKFQIDINSP